MALIAALGYPAEAMNVRGERILIFGDSLTQHSSGNNPIWNVDAGSQRSHHAPGDLLASLLLEQGAAAVRTNALVSRSAFNFWTREPARQLIADDLAWKPTKIVFVLGTNDIGLATAPDLAAFERLRDAYKPSKAELWAIGPFRSGKPAAGIDAVAATMRKAFGSRFIDGRKLTTLISPGSDGLHYSPASARMLALNMADALVSASPVKPWMGIAIGVAVVVTGGFVFSLISTRKRGLAGVEILDGKRWAGSQAELVRSGARQVPCKSGLDRGGQARCWTRGQLGAMTDSDYVALSHTISDYKHIARRRKYDQRDKAFASCDIATPEFVRKAAENGVTLESYRFNLTRKEDFSAITRIYGLTKAEAAKLRAQVQAAEDQDCQFHEVAVAEDGMAIDWTANQFKKLPVPFIFRLREKPKAAPAPVLAPRVTHLPADRAEIVAAAARAVPSSGRYGADSVFVSEVHRKVQEQGINISLEDFKRELIRMLPRSEVILARADLPHEMDRRLVEASEIESLGSQFHFVVLPDAREGF